MLAKARAYEIEAGGRISPEERPLFHLSTRVGWLNDPNGFCFYKGKYHLFYQYHPYDTKWGPMHWGHAVSEDLLHWEYLGAAIAPDEEYDAAGCFSGSAVELDDGRQLLIYTGVSEHTDGNGRPYAVQCQCLAFGDGENYVKYEKNPILTGENLPEGLTVTEFRDPKVWKAQDGTYRMVACCAASDHDRNLSYGTDAITEAGGRSIQVPYRDARIAFFASLDGIHYSDGRILAANGLRFGTVWECPDFFNLDGRWVLLTNPMDMEAEGLEYISGNGTLCLIGDYDNTAGTFTSETDQAVDYGIDFYAAQTILTPDGRRVMIAWMQDWDTAAGYRYAKDAWFGQMTVPRELSVRDGRLYQTPVRELESLRHDRVEYTEVQLDGSLTLDGVSGRCVDLTLDIESADPEDIYDLFELRFAAGGKCYSCVTFRPKERTVEIDRSHSGSRRKILHTRRTDIGDGSGSLSLRVILDRFSAEVFIDGGYKVMTMNISTDLTAEGIEFICCGRAVMNLVHCQL